MTHRRQHRDYRLVDELAELDLDVVHRALSQQSYWARGRPREVTEAAFASSRVAAAIGPDGETAGFARAVTDGATFAWICDVWVEPPHRGCGLGHALIDFLLHEMEIGRLPRLLLRTKDAHEVYASSGFTPLENPQSMMERRR